MRDEVIAFLMSMGVMGVETDPVLDYVLNNVTKTILNVIHHPTIPEGLESVAIYRTTGEYLHLKKSSGQLKEFNLAAVEKQIKEGDTSITFAFGEGSKTPEQRLDELISLLMTGGSDQLTTYRRFRW